MLGGLLVLVITSIISFLIVDDVKRRYPFANYRLLRNLIGYHLLLSLAYYGYVLFNPSDSKFYYVKVFSNYRGDRWSDFYGTSTQFVEFIGFPFIQYLGFSYEAIMALFSFFGFLGFIYFYIFFSEQIKFKHTFMGIDLVTLIFFLPNLHFWSASFGKGALIFLGLGLFFYGIGNIRSRIVALVIAGLIVYHVRPHVMLVVLVSTAIGFVFSTKGVSVPWRIVFLIGASAAFFFIYRDVLTMVGIDEEQIVTQGLGMSHRASELSKATSGVDITQYSLPFQLFTFLYRPLFIDAPGALGIIVSFENVLYLLLTLQLLANPRGWKFLVTGGVLVKSAFLSFFTVSIALAQISGNLGLAMRQKSQVMILFMFVIISFLDEQKLSQYKLFQRRKKLKERMQKLAESKTGSS